MFKLDNNFLIELGLGSLPPEEKNRMLQHIYETLEMRVGMKLAEQMSDSQLDEFEGFINRNDEAGALNWLETNFPNYKQVVADELEKLKAEIKQVAPQIVAESMAHAASQQQATAPAQQGYVQPPQDPYGNSPQSTPQTQPQQYAPQQPYQPAAPGVGSVPPQQFGPAPQMPPAPQQGATPYQPPQDPYTSAPGNDNSQQN